MKNAKDISILFAQWIVDNFIRCPCNDTFIWYYNNGDFLAKNTEDLFDIFTEEQQI